MEEKKSPLKRYIENLGETRPWHLLNPSVEKTTIENANKRYQICLGCPELIQLTKQCKKCGCLMYAKVSLEKSSCPINKW
jgi:hypothetical protein